jgi:hypothetical protein
VRTDGVDVLGYIKYLPSAKLLTIFKESYELSLQKDFRKIITPS